MITLDPKSTALVLIDLQNGIVARPLVPVSAADLVAHGKSLAERFRAAGGLAVLVSVGFSNDGGDMPSQRVDQEPMKLPEGGFPAGWTDLVPGLAQPGDVLVTKKQWGAFYGTDLDLQLRRRGIRTIVLGGVATHIGVESTARQAWEHGYELVIATDATTSTAIEPHEASMRYILPRISRLTDSDSIAFAGA
jgi:nicotinamidase-related amidase